MCHSLGGHDPHPYPIARKGFAAATLIRCRHRVRVTFLNTNTVERNLGPITRFGCVRHHLGKQLGIPAIGMEKTPGAIRSAFCRHRGGRGSGGRVGQGVLFVYTKPSKACSPGHKSRVIPITAIHGVRLYLMGHETFTSDLLQAAHSRGEEHA